MTKWLGGLGFAVINLALLWQFRAATPLLPPLLAGILLMLFNLTLGVGIGSSSMSEFARDVQRLNRYLGDQNEELVSVNRELLDRFFAADRENSSGHSDVAGQSDPQA